MPLNITHLTIGENFITLINTLNLKYLKINGNNNTINNLPDSLEEFELGPYFNMRLNNLPPTLEYLELPAIYNMELENIPHSLKILKCTYNYYNEYVINYDKFIKCIIK